MAALVRFFIAYENKISCFILKTKNKITEQKQKTNKK